MTDSLEQLTGGQLAGQYRLEELLGDDQRSAFFQTAFHGSRAVIQVRREPLEEWWQRAAQLDHPNLQRVLDAGRSQDLSYLVFEYPEDRLSTAMEKPLSRDEAQQVVAALRDALAYLHAHGFAHGAVTAGHIVAVGDTIKLESDTLRPASPAEQVADQEGLDRLAARLGLAPPPPRAKSSRPGLIVAAAVVTAAGIVGIARHAAESPAPPPPVTYIPPPARASTAPAAPAHAPGNWRVIAYTYTRYPDAAKKVAGINQKYPEFHAEVYTPNGRNRGPYLVALGGRTTRVEAERLEKKARARGLPHDTFARNYSN